MKLPIRRKILKFDGIEFTPKGIKYHYWVQGAFSSFISKKTGLKLHRYVNKIPQSWYVDNQYKIHRPFYRKYNTELRNRLKDIIDYLDGSSNSTVKEITKIERR